MSSLMVNFWSSTINESARLHGLTISLDEKIKLSLFTYLFYGVGAIFSPRILGIIYDNHGYKLSLLVILSL